MKILIIGGTGLISVSITKFLLDRGEDVTLFNRGQSFLPTHLGAKVVHGDRTDYTAFEEQIEKLGHFDVVMDMVGYKPEDGESVVRAFSGQVGHFIFCSTVDVYRKPAIRYPVVETEPYGGLNAYSRNKIRIEKILLEVQLAGSFPLTIIRPAYTYGESRAPVYILEGKIGLLDRIRRGKRVILHGDGSSFWTACHRDDVARAFVAAAYNPNTFGKTYHTPGEEWMTWNLYLQRVAEAMGAPEPKIVHIPTEMLGRVAPKRAVTLVTNFQFSNIFDTTAARSDLGFCYTIPWVEGVRRMVAWLEENDRIEKSDLDPFMDNLVDAWEKAGEHLDQLFTEE
jgi:nucleoside-diphosphate-sugar epimerase